MKHEINIPTEYLQLVLASPKYALLVFFVFPLVMTALCALIEWRIDENRKRRRSDEPFWSDEDLMP